MCIFLSVSVRSESEKKGKRINIMCDPRQKEAWFHLCRYSSRKLIFFLSNLINKKLHMTISVENSDMVFLHLFIGTAIEEYKKNNE